MATSGAGAMESVLLLPVPAAEAAVSDHRAELDRSAADGIPAHITLLYPFVPPTRFAHADHSRLSSLFAQQHPLSITGSHTAWFGDRVLYVSLREAACVHELIAEVVSEFPEHPAYAGSIALEDIVPHLTIGADRPAADLRRAEREVAKELPFTEVVDTVELWAGPAIIGRASPAPWRRIRAYPLESASTLET